MRNISKRVVFAVAAVVFALLFGSCAQPEAIGEADSQKIQEIGDAFIDDLRNIVIPAREIPEVLAYEGYVLRIDDKSYGTDTLAEFAEAYDESGDSQVTIVFSDKSFMVVRIVFTGGQGYYLRYRYDQFKPDDIPVSAQLIDTVDLKYQELPPRWEMKLLYGKKEVVPLFRFSNPE